MPSEKRLIINADDFGIHQSVNRGIYKGYSDGCITSASLMPLGASFEEAVNMANTLPGLGVGIHLTLVGEKPLEAPEMVASLLDKGKYLHNNHVDFIKKYLRGKIALPDICRELRSQIKKTVASGLKTPPTHLDSHQHLHVLPGIINIVIALALEFNIKAIRIPSEGFCFKGGYNASLGRIIGRSGLTTLALLARRKIKKAGLIAPENFFGMLAGGNLKEEILSNILSSLPPGTSEIMVHPGDDDLAISEKYDWPYNWQKELAGITSPKILEKIVREKIQLISFENLKEV